MHEGKADVVVDMVVPVEELPCPGIGILRRTKVLPVGRAVLHALELRLTVRIVIAAVGPGI